MQANTDGSNKPSVAWIAAICLLALTISLLLMVLPVDVRKNPVKFAIQQDVLGFARLLYVEKDWKSVRIEYFDSENQTTWPSTWDRRFLKGVAARNWRYVTPMDVIGKPLGQLKPEDPVLLVEFPDRRATETVLRVHNIVSP